METVATIDVTSCSRFNKGPEAPLWWGILGLILIEGSVVAAFVTSHLYYRSKHDPWPPPGIAAPELLWPTVAAVLLLASCYPMWLAGRLISSDRPRAFVAALTVSLALASMVLLLRWQQFQTFDFRWDTNAYGSIVWTITGFHFMHVVSAVIGTAVVAVLGVLGYFNKDRQLAVVVDTLYWYFVAVAWLPLYAAVYWVPRWT